MIRIETSDTETPEQHDRRGMGPMQLALEASGTEAAGALASRLMGRGDEKAADQAPSTPCAPR